MINMILYFLDVMLCTIGGLIICGLVAHLFEKLFVFFVGGAFGFKAIIGTAIIGTPVHEAGHAIMCLIFGHKIEEIKLYEPDMATGTLGYVSHSYNPKNIYQRIGNLFIGLGPIFSGLAVITMILFTCFTSSINEFFHNAFTAIDNGESMFSILGAIVMLPWNMIIMDGNVLFKILGFLIIASVIMHINLSPADIKGSISGLTVFTVIAAIFTLVTSFLSAETVATIRNALHVYAMYCFVVFTLIYIFALIIIIIVAIPYLIKLKKKN